MRGKRYFLPLCNTRAETPKLCIPSTPTLVEKHTVLRSPTSAKSHGARRPVSPRCPRFRALALLGRRSPSAWMPHRCRRPRNLVWGRGSQAENSRHVIFSFNPISLFDLKAHFFSPTRAYSNAVARRGCQGWPSLRYLLMPRRCQATP